MSSHRTHVLPHVARARIRALPWFGRFSLTAGGLGFWPIASGTWGSLPPCVIWLAMMELDTPDWMAMAVLAMLFLWMCIACVRFGGAAEQAIGSRDPGCIVADEVAGMCIALMGVHSWQGIAVAFFLFRVFDVLKPWPCGAVQHVRGGWGVLLDDLMAGVYAAICMHLLLHFVPALR